MTARDGPILDPAAAARMLDGVADSLARWFGPFGCHALLTRALAHARLAHPGLAALRVRSPLTPVLDGVADTAQTYGSAATTDGVTAVIMGVVDLVGGVIGDDMALQLLERYMEGPLEASLEAPGLAVPDPVTRHGAPHAAPVDGRRGVMP